MRHGLFILLFVFATNAFVQGQTKRAAHWFFGYEAGLDFNSGTPVADTTGSLISIEGCSSISDTLGNLLFYSNGQAVWNINNDTMPNGKGLLGNESAEQSSLIVPLPGSNSLYYLFTSNGLMSTSALRYNVIDMTLNGGLGDVTSSKNISLFSTCTEGLGGTIHCNAKDYWIVAR